MTQELITELLLLFAVISIVVNIVTEIAKMIYTFGSDKKLNLFVTIISVILAVFAYSVFWCIQKLGFEWYLIPTFIIVGVLDAYAAMFGYDKLISKFKELADIEV